MNDYQTKLFNDLTRLAKDNDVFYVKDFELEDNKYRIWNYRYASYTDLNNESAVEAKGVTFEIDKDDKPIRLASLPFQKLFNLNEMPDVTNLDLLTVTEIVEKEDGSMISTYFNKGFLCVKSKGSLFSEQAVAAFSFLQEEDNMYFWRELIYMERLEYTVTMQWCSPNNKIILPYKKPELKVLGIRNRHDGKHINRDSIDSKKFPEIQKRLTPTLDLNDIIVTPKTFIENISKIEKTKSYICKLESDTIFEVKTDWYAARHKSRRIVDSPRLLFQEVLKGKNDEFRSLFSDDPKSIKVIDDMDKMIVNEYKRLVDAVEFYYAENEKLDKKEYAMLAKIELTKLQFKLAMRLYLGKDFSYVEVMKKRWKELKRR